MTAKKIIEILSAVAMLVLAVPSTMRATTYYSRLSGAPTTLGNWNSVPGGSGFAPTDFTSGDVFVIQSGHTMTTTTSWTVSGGATIQINSGGTLSLTGIVLSIGGNLNNNGMITNATGGVATITFTSSGSYSGSGIVSAGSGGSSRMNWMVNSGATLSLAANFSYLNTGVAHRSFTVNGTLDCGPNALTGGSGIDFYLGNSGATLATANTNGINGSLKSFASVNLPSTANYIFNGSLAQVPGTLWPATNNDLTISNSKGLTLTSNAKVNGTLALTSSQLNLNSPTLTPINAGTLTGNGTTTINVLSGNFFAGQSYPLFQYTTIGGSGGFALGSLPPGFIGTLGTNGHTITLTITGIDASASALRIVSAGGGLQLLYSHDPGHYSYELFSGPDLESWIQVASLREQGLIQWPLPASEMSNSKRFFKINKVVAQGLSELAGWSDFQSSTNARYKIGLIGDSYTQNRARYALRLKTTLATQYGDLGAGFLGFASFSSAGLNSSIDNTKFDYTISYAQWTTINGNGYGPDAGHVTSFNANASLSMQVLQSVDNIKLYYANQPGTAGFQYQVQESGTTHAWTPVTTDAVLSLGTTTIDVHSYSAPYTINIQTLGVGVSLIGAEAIKAGSGVVVHKLGDSGGTASQFAANSVAKASLNELDLDMAIIMFGTNEQNQNQTPAAFKAALQNIITSLRTYNTNIDVVLMLPCYTQYELEMPKAYKLHDYGQVMQEVAAANHAAFIDFTQVFGPATALQDLINTGLMNADRIHPSTTGIGSGGYLMADTITWSVLSLFAP